MPRDAASKKPHKTSRPPKAQREAQKAARKKTEASAVSREIAARLAERLDGPKRRGSQGGSYAQGKPYGQGKSYAQGKPRSQEEDFRGTRPGKSQGGTRPGKSQGGARGGFARNASEQGKYWNDGGSNGTRDAARSARTSAKPGYKQGSKTGKFEKAGFEKTSKAARFGDAAKASRPARPGKPAGQGKPASAKAGRQWSDRSEKPGRAGKPAGASNRSGKPAGASNRFDKQARTDNSRNASRAGKPARPENAGRQSRPARSTDSARASRPGRGERSAKEKPSPAAAPPAEASRVVTAAFSAAAARAREAAKSPCPVDAQCGGCEAIALPYNQQLLLKNALVADLFDAIEDDFELRPILGMDDPFRYRNKIISPFAPGKKLKQAAGAPKAADQKKAHKHGLTCEVLTGMYEQGTHELVPTTNCLVENALGQQIVAAIKAIMERRGIEPYNEDTGEGFLRHAVIRIGHESGEVLVTVVANEEGFPAGKSFAKELIAQVPQVTTVVQNINTRQTNVILGEKEVVLYGPGFILDTLCGLSFRISSTSFYQVNSQQTEVLYNTAVNLAQLDGTQTVIDAYCGTGTIGLVAASRGAKRVIGVESVAAAVRDARENARHNGIENAAFVAADATRFMQQLAGVEPDEEPDYVLNEPEDAASFNGEAAALEGNAAAFAEELAANDLVLLMDPPRAGATPAFLQAAVALGPARIVYVSCNPATQVRDIAQLQEAGYSLKVVQPVDMFPHTSHVECVALLAKEQ